MAVKDNWKKLVVDGTTGELGEDHTFEKEARKARKKEVDKHRKKLRPIRGQSPDDSVLEATMKGVANRSAKKHNAKVKKGALGRLK